MSALSFNKVATLIFGLVAAVQLARLIFGFPILIGGVTIPIWASGIGVLVAGGMSLWGLRTKS